MGFVRKTILVFGCGLAAWLIIAGNLEPGKPEVSMTAGVAVLMATLWITEVIPLAATALLPVIWFPILGILNGKDVSKEYFNHVIFLFIGGFIVALAMQRWNLHRRIALKILLLFGTRPAGLLLGFMLATAFLSMWISNTAAAMMMVTIAAAVLSTMEKQAAKVVAVAILLGVAYAASIGGMATLVGTPPNLSFVRLFAISFPNGPPISFADWMMVAVPVSVLLFVITWFWLWLVHLRGRPIEPIKRETLTEEYRKLGPMDWPQWVVLADFLCLILLWMTRVDIDLGFVVLPGWSIWLPNSDFVNDGTVAVVMATLLFAVPSREKPGEKIMDWPTAVKLPWNIVLLFGGGFALAAGIVQSGLSEWLGGQMEGLSGVDPLIILVMVCLVITFLTELTSNTATTEMILPIMASLAVAIEVHPLFLMVPVTMSCSCAFMMPVATPPNAIVFGTGQLKISQMVKTGLLLNFIAVAVVATMAYYFLPFCWGFEIDQLPQWAK